MSRPAPRSKTSSSYPYEIRPVSCPSNETLKKLNPWAVLEFFRIEALLRSKTIWAMGRKGARGGDLWRDFRITWKVLDGSHHHLLHPMALEETGVADIDKWKKVPATSALQFINPIREESPRFLHLQIDCAYQPTTIINAIRPVLKDRHSQTRAVPERSRYHSGYSHPQRPSPIRQPRAWFAYLKAYDLRHREQWKYGSIAKEVYGTGNALVRKRNRQRAETGVHRFESFIASAERDDWREHWPPLFRQSL